MTTSDASHHGFDGLITSALRQLKDLGYAPGTITNYRYVWTEFNRFARKDMVDERLSTDLVRRFLMARGIPVESDRANLNFYQRHIKNAMRVLTEFAFHGCFQRRSHVVEKTTLSPSLQNLLSGYEEYSTNQLKSASETLRTRKRHITRFLHHLDAHGVTSMVVITPSIVSEFLMSRSHLKPATLAGIISSLRSFLRYLCMQGMVPGDLADHIPKIRLKSDARIPSVWNPKDVEALLGAVDRSSPVGKRDYAILLLAVRLGMRVGDIRSLCLEHLHWDSAQIEMVQTKTGRPMAYPMTEEVGTAFIDYLRHGRPKTRYRAVFLRANAPFEPFASNNNLYHIITTYRRRAGIVLPAQNRRGFHSLRHTLASRLLEAGVPLETISGVMGHVSVETTQIYTKIDIEALRSVAIDPVEVGYA